MTIVAPVAVTPATMPMIFILVDANGIVLYVDRAIFAQTETFSYRMVRGIASIAYLNSMGLR